MLDIKRFKYGQILENPLINSFDKLIIILKFSENKQRFDMKRHRRLHPLTSFMMVCMIANKWAISARSYSKQYMGLGLYILAQALILVPLLFIAEKFGKPGTIGSAGVISGFVFTGLTLIVFFTRADLSWMRKALMLMSFVFLGMILCGILFEFHFGMLFSCLGIGLAGGYILYYTSQIMLRFHTDQHVVAALCLFAAVILLFWYILSLLMELQRR